MNTLTSPIACGRTCLCGSGDEATALDARTRCPVLADLRKTPAQRMAEYADEVQRARLVTSIDVPHKLQQLGVPYDAVSAARKPQHNVAMSAAMRFRDADVTSARMLILAGDYGVGKSTAAAWLLGKAVERFDWDNVPSGTKLLSPFLWTHASEVTSEIDFGRVSPDWLTSLRKARYLVLDDLGKDATQVGRTALRDVLVERLDKHRPTVITSNLGPEQLRSAYGDSWFERAKAFAMVPDLSKEKSMRAKPQSRSVRGVR